MYIFPNSLIQACSSIASVTLSHQLRSEAVEVRMNAWDWGNFMHLRKISHPHNVRRKNMFQHELRSKVVCVSTIQRKTKTFVVRSQHSMITFPRVLAIDTTFPHPTPVEKKQWFDIHPGLTLETIVI